MTKADIAWKLWVDHDVWECGYSLKWLERNKKKDLERWLADSELGCKVSELAKAYREADALLKKKGIPETIEKRVRGIGDDAKKRIAKRQEEIKVELAAVADAIEKRKRRANRVE